MFNDLHKLKQIIHILLTSLHSRRNSSCVENTRKLPSESDKGLKVWISVQNNELQ